MKLLYNTETEELLAWPRLDNEPIVGLALYLRELTVVEETLPSYDSNTQTVVRSETVDLDEGTVTRSWTVTPLFFSAEQWISKFLTSLQIIGLQRLEMGIVSSGGTLGPLMTSMKQWLEGILSESVNPEPRSNWPEAPTSYQAAVAEAVTSISNNESE